VGESVDPFVVYQPVKLICGDVSLAMLADKDYLGSAYPDAGPHNESNNTKAFTNEPSCILHGYRIVADFR
jgi:hypothetical protein